MAIDMAFRRKAVAGLINDIGVYVLCDLDQVPIYVGQSRDGIRARVRRHLTSARSDIIANRQIDFWEIAWVWAFPVNSAAEIGPLEAVLYHTFNPRSALMNGTIPAFPSRGELKRTPKPSQIVQVMSNEEIAEKRDPALRLPRQAERYSEIVNHFLAVKSSRQIARAMQAHFQRLSKYHTDMLGLASGDEEAEE